MEMAQGQSYRMGGRIASPSGGNWRASVRTVASSCEGDRGESQVEPSPCGNRALGLILWVLAGWVPLCSECPGGERQLLSQGSYIRVSPWVETNGEFEP